MRVTLPLTSLDADVCIDQMGVELGKVLAKNILAQLDKPEDVAGHDSSVRTASALQTEWRLELIGVCVADNGPHSLLPEAPEGVTWLGACTILRNQMYDGRVKRSLTACSRNEPHCCITSFAEMQKCMIARRRYRSIGTRGAASYGVAEGVPLVGGSSQS